MESKVFKNPTHQAAYDRGVREQRERRAEIDARQLREYDGMERRAYMAGTTDALRAMEVELLRGTYKE